MAQRAMYADENTLEKNVPEELYKKFVEFVTPYGIQEEVYSKLKPWYAALLVQNLQLMDNSYSGSLEWICISFQRQWAKKTYWK